MSLMQKYRKWWGLTAFMTSTAMVYIDQSVLPIALPTLQKHLGATDVELLWCVNAYLLFLGVLVLAGGKLGAHMGYRKAFAVGMLTFGLASALCGMSVNAWMLIVSRALQGVGAALMLPSATTLLMHQFSPEERGLAIGIQASAGSLFLILGPFLGGYFTQCLSWRWIFWINLPFTLIGLLMIYLFIPPSTRHPQRIDSKGCIFFALCSTAGIVLLMQGREWGWISPLAIANFAMFLLLLFLLLRREKKARHPFLDLSLFRHPVYTAVNIALFMTQFILMIIVFRAIAFQQVLGWSPMKTGGVIFFASVPVLFMSMVGGILSDKWGPKWPISLGFAGLIFSFIWIAYHFQSSLALLFMGLLFFGIGLPLISTPSYASAMSAIPKEKAGTAFGTISTTRSIALSLGVAAIGAFINAVELHSLHKLLPSVERPILKIILAGGTQAESVLQNFTLSEQNTLLQCVKEAEVAGFFYSHIVLGILLAVAFIMVFFLHHRKSSHHLPQTPAEGWD